jgi:large subunit ribosomal protein L30
MKLAAIRIRGEVRKTPDLVETLKSLKLLHKNHCVIVEDIPQTMGMLRRASGYITWGPIKEDLLKELVEKRGTEKDQTHFKLSPPKGGFDRAGIRKYRKMRGACGHRGEDIEKLLRRMI